MNKNKTIESIEPCHVSSKWAVEAAHCENKDFRLYRITLDFSEDEISSNLLSTMINPCREKCT